MQCLLLREEEMITGYLEVIGDKELQDGFFQYRAEAKLSFVFVHSMEFVAGLFIITPLFCLFT